MTTKTKELREYLGMSEQDCDDYQKECLRYLNWKPVRIKVVEVEDDSKN